MVPEDRRVWPRQASLFAMLIAPFVPWFSVPIPLIVFVILGLPSLLTLSFSGPTAVFAGAFFTFSFGLLISAVLAYLRVRHRRWRSALWYSMINLGCGATLLGIFLIVSGFGPVEPWGYVSPLAFLALAALPASIDLAGRWLGERRQAGGEEAFRVARARFSVLFGAFVGSVVGLLGMFMVAAQATISTLPAPHFYWDEMLVRESAAQQFAIFATLALIGILPALRVVLGRRDRSSASAA